MNVAVASVLNKVLGDFIDNLNPAQLNLSVFKGKINLANLSLKPKIMDLLGIPLKLKYGLVGKIDVDIPWSSLGSTPLSINIDEIIAVLAPKPDKDWSQEETGQKILAGMQESLDNFDQLNRPEFELSEEPGYFEKLLERIIDNVQIVIKRIYLRYEDKITYGKHFCLGVKLLEAIVVTCDNQWKMGFVSDDKFCYKFARVADFSIFLDLDARDLTKKETRVKAIGKIMNDDFTNKIPHNYILNPLTLEVKLTINKKTQPDENFITLMLSKTDEINMSFMMQHLSVVLKILNYFSVYDIFIAGVIKTLSLSDMPEDLKPAYREAYLAYRKEYLKSADSSSTENAKKNLTHLEHKLNITSIKKERDYIIKTFNIEKMIEKKEKEIEEVKKEGKGTMAKVSKFFSFKSEKEEKQEAEERERKLVKLKSDIDSFNEDKKELEAQRDNFEEKTESKKIKIGVSLAGIAFSVYDDTNLLLLNKLGKFDLNLELSNSLFLYFSLKSVDVILNEKADQVFPFLLVVKATEFELNESILKLSNKGIEANANLPVILNIVNSVLSVLNEANDLDKFIERTTKFATNFISSGQSYLKSVIKEGAQGGLKLKIDLKAPVFYVPGKNNFFLVADFGSYHLSTESKKGKNDCFDNYAMNVENIHIYKAQKFTQKETWKNLTEVLYPVNMKYDLRIYSRKNNSDPMFKLYINSSKTDWNISLAGLKFILDLVDSLSPETKKQELAIIEPVEVENYSDMLKNFGEIQPWSINAALDSFTLKIQDELSDIFFLDIEKMDLKLQISCKTRVQISLLIDSIKIADQKVLYYKEIISKSPEAKTKHLRLLLDYNPSEYLTEVSAGLSDSQICINKSSFDNILKFSNEVSLLFTPSDTKHYPKTFTKTHSKFLISVFLTSVSVKLPINPSIDSSNITGVSFTTFLSYSTVSAMKNFYDTSLLYSEPIEITEEASINLSHFIIYQQSPSTSSKNTLLKPSRIGATYSSYSNLSEDTKRLDINTESLVINFSFYDIYSITKIAAMFTVPGNPHTQEKKPVTKDEKFSLNLDSDSLQINIIDDTSDKQKHILHCQLSNTSALMQIFKDSQEVDFSTLIYCNCFNQEFGAWEPLIEDWKILFELSQKSLKDPLVVSVKSENDLDLNVNSSILSQVSHLIKCLSFEFNETCHMADLEKSAKKGVVQYKIVNELNENIEVSLNFPQNTEVWAISPKSSYTFSQNIIDQLFINSNPFFKTRSSLEITQITSTLNIDVDGYEKVTGVEFEEVDTRGFYLKSAEFSSLCALVTTSEGFLRTIRILPGLEICNNSDIDLVFSYHGSSFEVPSLQSKALPTLFKEDIDSLLIKDQVFVTLLTGKPLIIKDRCLIVENFEYKVKGEKFFTVEINPAYTIHNLLPGCVELSLQNRVVCQIPAGEKSLSSQSIQNGEKYSIKISTNQGDCQSADFLLSDDLKAIDLLDAKGKISVEIKDEDLRENSESNLSVYLRQKRTPGIHSSKLITFYIDTIVLNKTNLDLIFSDILLVQNSWIFFSGNKGKLKIKDPETKYCKDFNTNTISLSGCITLPSISDNSVYNLGVQISMASFLSLTKIIKILPRYIVSNSFSHDIYIKTKDQNHTQIITANSTAIFDPKCQKAAIQLSCDRSQWSGPFDIENLGDFQVKFLSDWNKNSEIPWKKGKFGFVRVLIFTLDEATINISFVDPQEPEYFLINKTDEIIKVSQDKFQGHQHVLKPGKKKPWVFDSLLIPVPKVRLETPSSQSTYSLDKIKECKKLGNFFVEVTVKDTTRTLEIRKIKEEENKETNIVLVNQMKFVLSLSKLGISITDARHVDLLYISLSDITAKMKTSEETLNTKTKKNFKYDLKIQDFQIDNMYTDESLYPVILNKQVYQKSEPDLTPFLQLKIYTETIDLHDGNPFNKIKWLEFCVQPAIIKINEETIFALINLKDFFSVFDQIIEKKIKNDLNCEGPEYPHEFSNVKRKAYFEFFRVCALKFEVTFRMSKEAAQGSNKSGFLPFAFLKSFGKAFTNISSAPIKFTEILITHGFQTIDNLLNVLLKNMIRQAVLQVFMVLGSSDMIGNPVGLIDKLGTGVFEFVNEPAKGLLKGPKAFAQGLGKGVRSLVGGIVAGSFESISKISGSLYNVLSEVGGDASLQRQETTNLYHGLKNDVIDISSGITGVFTKPFKGAKEQGAKGFFKGVGTGIFGLVSTPFKIVLKIGSTLTSGIAKGATLLSKGQIQTFGRVRFPRQCNYKQVLEPYNSELAQAKELIRKETGDQRIINYSHVLDRNEVIFIITDKMIWVLNGDVVEKIFIKNLENMEVNLNEGVYQFDIGGKGKKIRVLAESYGVLVPLYYSIVSVAGNVPPFSKGKSKRDCFS